MAREYLRITPETTWGTYNGAGTPIIVDLDASNAFTMRPAPQMWEIRSAAGFNRRRKTGSSKTTVAGALSLAVYPSQVATLIPWICATSANVLGSVTIDHAAVMEDSGPTTVYRRYLGVMVGQAQFQATEQSQLARLSLQLVAKQPATITVTDFPAPAVTDYPGDAPYVFEHLSGGLTFGSSRAEAEEFSITIKNTLDGRHMLSQYLTRLKYCGRDVDFSMRFPYITQIDRTDYEAITAVAASAVFTNAGHTLTFQMNSQNFVADVKDDLALDKLFLESIDAKCYFDSTAGTPNDLSISST